MATYKKTSGFIVHRIRTIIEKELPQLEWNPDRRNKIIAYVIRKSCIRTRCTIGWGAGIACHSIRLPANCDVIDHAVRYYDCSVKLVNLRQKLRISVSCVLPPDS